MFLFKKEKKKDILKGRTIRYLVGTGLVECSGVHLSNVLNGKIACSKLLAKNIVEVAQNDAKIEDYFMEK